MNVLSKFKKDQIEILYFFYQVSFCKVLYSLEPITFCVIYKKNKQFIITFDSSSPLTVVQNSQLTEELSTGHNRQELALPGYLDLALLHDVHDAADVTLLDDCGALGILHGVHHFHDFLKIYFERKKSYNFLKFNDVNKAFDGS